MDTGIFYFVSLTIIVGGFMGLVSIILAFLNLRR